MCQVSRNIKRIIHIKGKKQYCVALASGFSPKHFNNLLNGRKVLRAEYIVPIAAALETDPETLFTYHLKEPSE